LPRRSYDRVEREGVELAAVVEARVSRLSASYVKLTTLPVLVSEWSVIDYLF
jgi:hypothetical protein